MNISYLHVSFAALALAAPLFASSTALAGTTCKTDGGTTVTISDPASCHFETSGGCTAKCTPLSFTATCSAMCNASAEETCTDTCKTTCNTECTKQPDTFTCEKYCSTDCEAGCKAECDGDSCSSECSASCSTQCAERCQVHPGATECTTLCADSCTASCTVQANISCDVDCTSDLKGGCTSRCSEPSGGLFCDNQFIDVAAIEDCTFTIKASATGSLSTSCAAAPPGSTPFSIPAGLAAIAGLGLLVSRRRRQQ